jgi:hypothetical protein
MQDKTAVAKGADFEFNGVRYQVKANRPSGKPGSRVTLVSKARNYDWDFLIWIHYTTEYSIQEAWQWAVSDYKNAFDAVKRLSPNHMRQGTPLGVPATFRTSAITPQSPFADSHNPKPRTGPNPCPR